MTSQDASIPDMPSIRIDPSRASVLSSNISSILSRISSASSQSSTPKKPVRLVCVSKLKPASDILSLHQPPSGNSSDTSAPLAASHFGENYLDELQKKASLLPDTVRWHFIGQLQSNKCVSLARDTRSLWCVASVDSEKKARLLDRGWRERDREKLGGEEKLRVSVQVNTSGEESKGGVEPDQATAFCRFVRTECQALRLQGLMTIGAIARSKATGDGVENEDFICLRETRDRVTKELELTEQEELELSMGMSEDFEGAIKAGSDEVRVGSVIFGERPAKKDAKVI